MNWNDEDFKAWKDSPHTKGFLGFLNDVRERLKEKWAAGVDMSQEDHAVAMVYGDICGLNYEDVDAFYNQGEDTTNDEGDQ